jgi:Cu/Ag efflux protein CusF
MDMQRAKKICYVVAAMLASPVVGGIAAADNTPAQQQQNPTEVMAEKTSATATVEKIDTKNRQLTLNDDQGNSFKLDVPASVTRFDSIKKGDKIAVDYYSSIALSLKGNDATPPSEGTTTMKERTPGALPGGLMARKITASVEVMNVDKTANKLTIKGPNGDLDTVDVRDPSMQADLAKIKKGDKIHASYMEAVAVTVKPQAG